MSGFWMSKGNDHHLANGDAIFGNSSRLESKRSHQWFADATEAELFPNKRQAIESPNSKSISGYSNSHLSWDNVSVSALQSSPNQFIDRLLGSPDGNLNKKIVHDQVQLENGSAVGLSMSYTIEDPESLNYGGIRKVKVNQVKDIDSNVSNFITMGPNYNEDGNVTLMGHSYSGFDTGNRSTISTSKDEMNSISFSGFQDETEPINGYYVKAMNNYGLSFDESTVKPLQSPGMKELDVVNTIGVVVNAPQGVKSKSKLEKAATFYDQYIARLQPDWSVSSPHQGWNFRFLLSAMYIYSFIFGQCILSFFKTT